MKKIMLIASLIGGSLLLAGCQKEFGKGGEVRFVASSVAGPQTRAEYSGEGTTSGGLLTWERINWQTGDVLRIWSDAAKTPDNANYSDYKVSSFNVKSRDNTRSQATVENAAEHGDETKKGPFAFGEPGIDDGSWQQHGKAVPHASEKTRKDKVTRKTAI